MHLGCFTYCGSLVIPLQNIQLNLGLPLEVKITSSTGVVYYTDNFPDTSPFTLDLSELNLNEDMTFNISITDSNLNTEIFSFTTVPNWIWF